MAKRYLFLFLLLNISFVLAAQHFVANGSVLNARYYSKVPYRELLKGRKNYGTPVIVSGRAAALPPMGETLLRYSTSSGSNQYQSPGWMYGFTSGLEGKFTLRKIFFAKALLGGMYRRADFKEYSFEEAYFMLSVSVGFPLLNRLDFDIGYTGFFGDGLLVRKGVYATGIDVKDINCLHIGLTHHFSNTFSVFANGLFNFRSNTLHFRSDNDDSPPMDVDLGALSGLYVDSYSPGNMLEVGLRWNIFQTLNVGEISESVIYVKTTNKKIRR